MGRALPILAGCAALCVLVLAWRPLSAWYADDLGNLALAKGHMETATAWFSRGLLDEPDWSLLHEDLGRSLLGVDPSAALVQFRAAACGTPCIAEEGDAYLRLARRDEAISKYIAAKAVARLGQRAQELARAGDDGQAIALEQALIARLHDTFLERAELASAYATLGDLQMLAAFKQPAQAAKLRRAAIVALRHASSLAPFNERYLLAYGFAELQWGDRNAARAAFGRLLQLHPQQADAEAALRQLAVPATP